MIHIGLNSAANSESKLVGWNYKYRKGSQNDIKKRDLSLSCSDDTCIDQKNRIKTGVKVQGHTPTIQDEVYLSRCRDQNLGK